MRMKYCGLILIIIASVVLFSCAGIRSKADNPGFQHFKITIEQDGGIKDIDNHVVRLAKKPFTIVCALTENIGIFVNASFKPSSFLSAMNGEKIDKIPGFRDTAMDEELFNKDESLAVSDNSPNFWNYTNDSDHRFNEIVKRPGMTLCRRNISRLVFQELKRKIDISAVTENELDLVFMKLEWNNDYSKKIEIKRDYLKIIFSRAGE